MKSIVHYRHHHIVSVISLPDTVSALPTTVAPALFAPVPLLGGDGEDLCSPVEGLSGVFLTSLLIALAFVGYTWHYRRSHRLGLDPRPPKVFWCDVGKIALSQALAFLLNVLWGNKLARTEADVTLDAKAAGGLGLVTIGHHHLQSIAWTVPLLLINTLVGLPLGAAMGVWATRACRLWLCRHNASVEDEDDEPGGPDVVDIDDQQEEPRHARAPEVHSPPAGGDGEERTAAAHRQTWTSAAIRWWHSTAAAVRSLFEGCRLSRLQRWWLRTVTAACRTNAIYGKYSPSHRYGQQEPEVRWTWWAAQAVSWCTCVVASRWIALAFVDFWVHLYPSHNLFWSIAATVDAWAASCATKQLVVSGALRLLLDLFHIVFIDVVNRLPKIHRSDGFDAIPER